MECGEECQSLGWGREPGDPPLCPHSPASQWGPLLPGGQGHVPLVGSQVALWGQWQSWSQLSPKVPGAQAGGTVTI